LPLPRGDDPRVNTRRAEEAKREIEVAGTAENENFLPTELERVLSIAPQFLIIDAVVPAPPFSDSFFTEGIRADQLPVVVRPKKIHQPAVFSAP